MNEKLYSILLGDVIGSVNIENTQNILHKGVKETNKSLNDSIIAPFEITRGDEIALVSAINSAWFTGIINFINNTYPIKIRWSVVIGEITEGLESGSAAEMLGSGFVSVDKDMRELKKTDMLFSFSSHVDKINQEISGIVNLYLLVINKLTEFQYKVFRKYQEYGNQKKVAKKLGKTQQQVQSSLKSINWESIDLAEKSIMSYLDRAFKILE